MHFFGCMLLVGYCRHDDLRPIQTKVQRHLTEASCMGGVFWKVVQVVVGATAVAAEDGSN